eukprot:TRINITY_DN2014_c0_g1_i1.p1 TRINITY_DN2014_c0_g1~~TRINITY_DN2014_c0_g1_i1.p1  ORF type:complete len:186 (-),score=32.42 TRINITY_DN2014_c0_g1_i1:213-770(-)
MSGVAIVVMGVSGCGKSTIASNLSIALNQDKKFNHLKWEYHDADDFHSIENKQKMGAGIPLTSEDRKPWLDSIEKFIHTNIEANKGIVFACSALKRVYRDQIKGGSDRVIFLYLKGSFEVILSRLELRINHYMKADLLASQFATLEEPSPLTEHCIIVDTDKKVDSIVDDSLILLESDIIFSDKQ